MSKTNQFGEEILPPIPVTVQVWGCAYCGFVSNTPISKKPPFRCGNRASCGRLFHSKLVSRRQRRQAAKAG